MKGRGKDNVWSVDNEMAEAAEKERERDERRKKKKGKRVRSVGKRVKGDDKVMVSGSMLMEIETVLQLRNRLFDRHGIPLQVVLVGYGREWELYFHP